MTKRITAVFIVLIIPLALLMSGCNASPKLTAKEYKAELMSGYEEFMTARMKIADIMMDMEQGGYTSHRSSEFEVARKDMESSMRHFESMNPPDNYKSRHKGLVKSLDKYRNWLKASEKVIGCTTREEFEKALKEANNTLDIENGFLIQYTDILIEVNKEAGAE